MTLPRSGALPAGIQTTDAPGVTTYYRSSSEPFTASLMFRVGRVDESLMNSGITHTVEHLAMSTVPMRRVEANAFVDPLRTAFYARGDQDRVLRMINAVAKCLQALPMDRLEAELGVLQAEDAGDSGGIQEAMRRFRWGTRGHGLVGFEYFGYSTMTSPELQAWSDRFFTAPNAVLWMTAPPPPDFVVDLPAGEFIRPADPEPLPFSYPAVLQGGDDKVVLTATGPRSAAFAAGTSIAGHRLRDVLRTKHGRSYEIISDYDPLSATSAYWFAGAAGRPEHAREVSARFRSALQELADAGPTEDELEDEKAERLSFYDGEDGTSLLAFLADWHLVEGAPPRFDELRAGNAQLEATDVAEALTAALATGLWLVPMAADLPTDLEEFPMYSADAVEGTRFENKDDKRSQLRVAADGVSVTNEGTRFATVRWTECDAILRTPKGDRQLVGRDAMRISVVNGQWKNGYDAIRLIDQHAPAGIFVDLRPQVFPSGASVVVRDGEEMFVAPSWEHDGWALIDLARHGGTNTMPALAAEESLAALGKGDLATILLTNRGEDGEPAATEALTAKVVFVADDFYGAIVVHAGSTLVPALGVDAGIAFEPHHVAAVRHSSTGAAWRGVKRLRGRRR